MILDPCCGAIEVAKTACENVEQLISEMLEGNFEDNEISLGRLLCGTDEIQVQLKVTRKRSSFLQDDETDSFDDLGRQLRGFLPKCK